MISIKKMNINFMTGLMKPVIRTNRLNDVVSNTKNTTLSKVNSLAYLAYKSRKQKGLIANDAECPTIFFGDEWAL
jgi:hypothetical protein